MDIINQIRNFTPNQWAKIIACLTALSIIIGIAKHFLSKAKAQSNKADIKNVKKSNIDINQKNN